MKHMIQDAKLNLNFELVYYFTLIYAMACLAMADEAARLVCSYFIVIY
jgi:hypothetical protein